MTQPNNVPQQPAPQQYPTGAQQPQYAPQQSQYAPQQPQQQQYPRQYAQYAAQQPAPQQQVPQQPVPPAGHSPISLYTRNNPIFLGLLVATGVYALLALLDFIMDIANSYLPMALVGIETLAQYAMLNLAVTFIGLLIFAYAPVLKATFFKTSLIVQCVGYGLWLVRWMMQLANSGTYGAPSSGYYAVTNLLWFAMAVVVVLNVLFLVLHINKLRNEPVVNGTTK